MNGNTRFSRRISATACAAVVIASSLGSAAAAEAQSRAIEQIDRYCRTSWRNAQIDRQDWEECTQQTFVEMLDRVSNDRWIEAIENRDSQERRELNRSIWCVAQRWRRAPRLRQMETDELARSAVAAEPDQHDRPDHDELLQVISSPDAGLSARQQSILRRWLDGDTVAEIASHLDLPAARVSDDKYKAIQKIRAMGA